MIEVVRRQDELNRQVWWFMVMDQGISTGISLVIDVYYQDQWNTQSNGWQTIKWYRRNNRRESPLTINDVPLPDDVAAEALQQFVARIKVVKE